MPQQAVNTSWRYKPRERLHAESCWCPFIKQEWLYTPGSILTHSIASKQGCYFKAVFLFLMCGAWQRKERTHPGRYKIFEQGFICRSLDARFISVLLAGESHLNNSQIYVYSTYCQSTAMHLKKKSKALKHQEATQSWPKRNNRSCRRSAWSRWKVQTALILLTPSIRCVNGAKCKLNVWSEERVPGSMN